MYVHERVYACVSIFERVYACVLCVHVCAYVWVSE